MASHRPQSKPDRSWSLILAVVVALLAQARTVASTSADAPLTAGELQRLVKAAVLQWGGDTGSVLRAMDTLVQNKWGPLFVEPIPVTLTSMLAVVISPPYVLYRGILRERLQKGLPIDDATLGELVVVSVLPRHIAAPDIIQVRVDRDGRTVPPAESTLAAHEFRSPAGAASIHGGDVSYPLAAFTGGGIVTVSATSAAGTTYKVVLDSRGLARFK